MVVCLSGLAFHYRQTNCILVDICQPHCKNNFFPNEFNALYNYFGRRQLARETAGSGEKGKPVGYLISRRFGGTDGRAGGWIVRAYDW
jgi:hypothetical protein